MNARGKPIRMLRNTVHVRRLVRPDGTDRIDPIAFCHNRSTWTSTRACTHCERGDIRPLADVEDRFTLDCTLIEAAAKRQQTPLSDAMAEEVLCVTGDVPTKIARELFLAEAAEVIFVVDGDCQLLGTLTPSRLLGTTTELCADVFLPHSHTFLASTGCMDALRACLEMGFRFAPVVSEGQLVGCVHSDDLLRWLVDSAPTESLLALRDAAAGER